MIDNKVVLSVCVITYGHEKYIRKALESILEQECNYTIEIIVANDASPDSTDEVVNKVIQSNNTSFTMKYYVHKRNIGMMQNFLFALERCDGKYIAILEGDDYWTDKQKLQKQIDLLESNESISMCFHRTDYLLQNGSVTISTATIHENVIRELRISDLAKGNFIHTPSVVFRSKFLPMPEKLMTSPIGDYPLWLHLATCGNLLYMPECMAHYREGVGVWSGSQKANRILLWCFTLFLCIDQFKEEDVKGALREQLNEAKHQLSDASFEELARVKDDLSLYIPFKTLTKSVVFGLLRKLKIKVR